MTPTTLSPGTRLGPFEIISSLGEGGMGAVYRARDTKLGREVAIKVLLPAVANDAERLARFRREAQVLASLNHPNIAHIHGIEEGPAGQEGQIGPFLVLELVEGPTLAEIIAGSGLSAVGFGQGGTKSLKPEAASPRALPLVDALAIAGQIAEALEAAHEHGIIHRDLKPANIKVRSDGVVKVLDFGLAKAMDAGAGRAGATGMAGVKDLSQSPTITTPAMTQAGIILGTAAYMSPEQARGGVVDKRADLWAFGVVLYEMLTAKRAFEGATVSDTIASVLKTDPDWAALPADTPAPIRKLLRRCLEKDRKRRFESAADARLEIEDALAPPAVDESTARTSSGSAQVAAAAATAMSRRTRLAWLVATAAVLGMAALAVPAVRYLREAPPAVALETRVDIVTPPTTDATSFALSPDGRQIVFVAAGDGAARLWLRSLGSTTAQPLAGTDGALYPFWSPDSRSVAFFAGGQLLRLDLGGGAPRSLAAAPTARGGTWNVDGVILFSPSSTGPLFRLSAAGGPAVPVTTLGRHSSHRWPFFLPDGRHFLFYAQGSDTAGMHLGGLDAGAPTRLAAAAGSAGVFMPAGSGLAEASREGGWVLWGQTRAGTIVAQRLDVTQAALTGEPVTLADTVAVDDINQRSAVSVSATGLVAFRAGGTSRRQLTWRDRTGAVLGTLGVPEDNLQYASVAPDGHRVAVAPVVKSNQDIWLHDGVRLTRFTFNGGPDRNPVWSPDGHRIVFSSDQAGPLNLYVKDASGADAPETRLVESERFTVATDWSADGRFILYQSVDPKTGQDLWVRPMGGDEQPWIFLKTPFSETNGRFSPDGHWVAYQSDRSGRNEIYVRPFAAPASAGRASGAASGSTPELPINATGGQQVSTAGGVFPSWRTDGHSLYYLGPRGEMMQAPIAIRGSSLEAGTPVMLFPAHIVNGGVDIGQGRQYDVTRDGRFLITTLLDDAVLTPITLLMNWQPAAKK